MLPFPLKTDLGRCLGARFLPFEKIIAVVLLAGMLSGCAGLSTREQRMLSGGAIGAAGGAAIGAAAGGSPAAGAAIGGVVGVAAGFVVDEIDRRKSESPRTN